MAPSKAPTSWEEEESDSSEGSSPPAPAVAPRRRFEDEEEEEVLDDWENDEDSEEEREKAKKAADAKAKADAEAKANKKSKSQRIEDRIEENRRKKESLLEDDSGDEDEGTRRAKAKASEKESDLQHAEDLFAGIGINPNRGAKPVTVTDESDPTQAVDLSSLSVFKPQTPLQFQKLRETLVPLLTANSKKPQYAIMMPELVKQLCKEMNSDQIKKVASSLSTLSNEKMKEEKSADKTNKKSKAAKTKTTLNADKGMANRADTMAYDDGLEDDDFM
ncbi:hypothetical protein KC345_g8884 [Hortaea werneckii]|nr:hypothetical protein KC345_g8884 [Hortaea werneckii]